jgi:uncharacterized membrane-anchored protein YjiN (DUF445 family)
MENFLQKQLVERKWLKKLIKETILEALAEPPSIKKIEQEAQETLEKEMETIDKSTAKKEKKATHEKIPRQRNLNLP